MDTTDKNIIWVIGALVVVAFFIYIYNNAAINYNATQRSLSASVLNSQYNTSTPSYPYSNYPNTSPQNYNYSNSASAYNSSTYYVPSNSYTTTTTYIPSGYNNNYGYNWWYVPGY